MTMNIQILINYKNHKEFAIEKLECLAFDITSFFLISLNYGMVAVFMKKKLK